MSKALEYGDNGPEFQNKKDFGVCFSLINTSLSGSFTRAVLFGKTKSLLARYSSFDALGKTGIQCGSLALSQPLAFQSAQLDIPFYFSSENSLKVLVGLTSLFEIQDFPSLTGKGITKTRG